MDVLDIATNDCHDYDVVRNNTFNEYFYIYFIIYRYPLCILYYMDTYLDPVVIYIDL